MVTGVTAGKMAAPFVLSSGFVVVALLPRVCYRVEINVDKYVCLSMVVTGSSARKRDKSQAVDNRPRDPYNRSPMDERGG